MYNNDFLVFGKKNDNCERYVHHGKYRGFKAWDSECCAHVCLYRHRVLIAVLKMSMAFDQGLLEDSAI